MCTAHYGVVMSAHLRFCAIYYPDFKYKKDFALQSTSLLPEEMSFSQNFEWLCLIEMFYT